MSQVVKINGYAGKGLPVPGNDIDTDRIIPARFMKCVTFKGLGQYAFYDERYDGSGAQKGHPFDDKRFAGHEVLLANKNFGCGSSREHAPQALMDYGIRAIIGESFAEIFAGNCTTLGIPAVKVSETDAARLAGAVAADPEVAVSIDLEGMKVTAGDVSVPCDMPAAYRNSLLDGSWDSTAVLLEAQDAIDKVAAALPYV